MGYRPHIVEQLKYGNNISGYNWRVGKFAEDLERLGVEYTWEEESEDNSFEIQASSIEQIDLNNVADDLKELAMDLKDALETPFAKSLGVVRVEWF